MIINTKTRLTQYNPLFYIRYKTNALPIKKYYTYHRNFV